MNAPEKKANRSKCYYRSHTSFSIAVIENNPCAETELLVGATDDDSKADGAVTCMQKCALMWCFRSDHFHHAKRMLRLTFLSHRGNYKKT